MLECVNVSKSYRGKYALDGLNMKIEPGHIYGLLGPNGSGKSTWMKTVAGLIAPDEGDILMNGQSIGPATKKVIAYMPTEPYFYNYMKIKDAGKYYQDFFEDFDAERFSHLLDKMQLDEDMKIRSLSSGMVAKLKVALTLSRHAQILMLDEPLNGIDLLAREAIEQTILDCVDEHATLIISSHLVDELEKIIDRVIFIKDGQVIESGDTDTLRQDKNISVVERYKELYR